MSLSPDVHSLILSMLPWLSAPPVVTPAPARIFPVSSDDERSVVVPLSPVYVAHGYFSRNPLFYSWLLATFHSLSLDSDDPTVFPVSCVDNSFSVGDYFVTSTNLAIWIPARETWRLCSRFNVMERQSVLFLSERRLYFNFV